MMECQTAAAAASTHTTRAPLPRKPHRSHHPDTSFPPTPWKRNDNATAYMQLSSSFCSNISSSQCLPSFLRSKCPPAPVQQLQEALPPLHATTAADRLAHMKRAQLLNFCLPSVRSACALLFSRSTSTPPWIQFSDTCQQTLKKLCAVCSPRAIACPGWPRSWREWCRPLLPQLKTFT